MDDRRIDAGGERGGERESGRGDLHERGARPADAEDAVLHAIEPAAAHVCRRWKPSILWLLSSGNRRYHQLAARLPRATPKMLTQQLRELERDGLVRREVRTAGPRHVQYMLTPLGDALRPAIQAFGDWSREYAEFAHARREQRHSHHVHHAHHEREQEIPRGSAHPADVRRHAPGEWRPTPRPGREQP